MHTQRGGLTRNRRRGAAAAFVLVFAVVMFGMAALTIDVGRMYRARAEAQSAADAAAMAAAWRLMDDDRLKSTADALTVASAARTEAVTYGAANSVMKLAPVLDPNSNNTTDGDVVLGYLSDPALPLSALQTAFPDQYNTVIVTVHRDTVRNGPILLHFAPVLGISEKDVSAQAAASFDDRIEGYRVTDTTGNAELLPFALHIDSWNNLLDGIQSTGDNYSYDPDTGAVTAGSDGINELNLYPGAGASQLPPGNFGTVDIGSPNNSTADLSRQIREGVNAEDLDYFGGELKFGPDGTLELNGDTGLSASVKDDLEFIKGLPRSIPLFNAVSGNGNNSTYTVVGFAGIRIMYVKLTGSMSNKQVIVQPAIVVDDAVITGGNSGTNYFVYQPVRLIR